MDVSKCTPGPWEWVEDRYHGGFSGLFGADDAPVIYPQRRNDGDTGAAWFDTSGDAGEECLSEADAQLIAEAGTVAHETGLSPRQLADKLKALEEAVVNFDSKYTNRDTCVCCGQKYGFPHHPKCAFVLAARK